MGRREPSFRGSPFSNAKSVIYFPGTRRALAMFPPTHPWSQSGTAGSREPLPRFQCAPERPHAPLLPPPRGVVQPSALVAVPEGPGGGGHPSSRRGCSTLSTSADARVPLDPGESSSPIANSGVIAQVFCPELQRDAGDGDPRSTYLELCPPQPPQPERGAAPRALPEGARSREGAPKLPTPGGGTVAASAEGAEPLPRSRPGWLRRGLVPPPLPPRLPAATGSLACPPPGPASHGPARPPPRPTPAPGGNLKPRLRPLRQPPPAEGWRPARLGFPPPAPSAEAGGDWRGLARPEEGEVAPWRRLPPRGSHRPRLGAA